MDDERRKSAMAARMRLTSALCAVLAAVVVVWQAHPIAGPDSASIDLRSTSEPISSSIKFPIIATTDPRPFDPCEDIPIDVINGIGLGFTPPEHEDGLRCHYDAGNYQMAVEAFVWRTYAQTLPPDAVEMDIGGHRAAQYWILKPSDRNNRFMFSCMIAFDTSYGVLQQSLFYAPVYSADDVDCMQTNLQRAQQLVPYYKF